MLLVKDKQIQVYQLWNPPYTWCHIVLPYGVIPLIKGKIGSFHIQPSEKRYHIDVKNKDTETHDQQRGNYFIHFMCSNKNTEMQPKSK